MIATTIAAMIVAAAVPAMIKTHGFGLCAHLRRAGTALKRGGVEAGWLIAGWAGSGALFISRRAAACFNSATVRSETWATIASSPLVNVARDANSVRIATSS